MKALSILLISALVIGCAEEKKNAQPVTSAPAQEIYPDLVGSCAVYSNIVKRWRNLSNTTKWTFYSNCTAKLEEYNGNLIFFDFRTNIVNESSAYPSMDDYMQLKVTSSNNGIDYPVGYYIKIHFWYIKEFNQVVIQRDSTSFAIGYIQF